MIGLIISWLAAKMDNAAIPKLPVDLRHKMEDLMNWMDYIMTIA